MPKLVLVPIRSAFRALGIYTWRSRGVIYAYYYEIDITEKIKQSDSGWWYTSYIGKVFPWLLQRGDSNGDFGCSQQLQTVPWRVIKIMIN